MKNVVSKQNITSKTTLRLIKELQTELSGQASVSRQNALKYDDVIREQRNKFYQSRDNVLDIETLEELDKCFEKLGIKFIEKNVPDLVKFNIRKQLLLQAMDRCWVEHLDKLESLKNGIGWRAKSGNNPILIYQEEAQTLYDNFLEEIGNVIRKVSEVE